MKISFIIPSVDRDKELQECIGRIEKAYEYSKNAEIEIIIVFQGSKEKKDIITKYPQLCAFHHIERKGLSLARNFAITKSSGQYLVFIDDDTSIEENFIEVLSYNISILKAGAFCCRDRDPVKKRFYSSIFLKNNFKTLTHLEFRYFAGNAHIIKKSVFDKIGFYDEEFGIGAKYPGAEESDMFFRIKQIREKIIYLHNLQIYHPIHSVTSELKCFNYSYAVGAMLTKQMFSDKLHLPIYLFIISETACKSMLRALQSIFFLESIRTKNLMFHYKSILLGTIRGPYDYIKVRYCLSCLQKAQNAT